MNSSVKLFLFLVMILFCGCSPQAPSKEVVRVAVKNIMPTNYEVVSVRVLKEVPGLIEVLIKMDKQPVVLYMDQKVQYVISGSLLNVETKKNLTIEAQKNIK
jgi:hypothetical protein